MWLIMRIKPYDTELSSRLVCHSGVITGAEGRSDDIVRFTVSRHLCDVLDRFQQEVCRAKVWVFFSFPQPKRRRAERGTTVTMGPSAVAILGTQLPGRDLAVEQQRGSKVGEAADSPNGSTMPFCTYFNCSKHVFSNAASDSSVSFVSLLN